MTTTNIATTIGLCAALLALGAPPAAAQDHNRSAFSRELTRTLPVKPGQRLEVEHSMGGLRITTHKLAEVRVKARIMVSAGDAAAAREFGEAISVTAENTGAAVVVRTRYPAASSGGRSRSFLQKLFGKGNDGVSYSVEQEILIPETMPVEARSRFGPVTADGLKAQTTISNANGNVAVRDGRGEHRIENRFGEITVQRHSGALHIDGANGAVEVTDVDGPLTVRNRFGRIVARRIKGKATIAGGNGSLTLEEVTGPASVQNAFGEVEVRRVTGALEVENRNGRVDVETVSGNATVRDSFGSVKLAGIGGDAMLDGENVSALVEKIEGAADVRGSFGKIRVTQVKRALRVVARNAEVRVDQVGGSAHLRNSFGQVEVDGVAGDVTAENKNGGVRASKVGGAVKVQTSFGPVRVDGAGGRVDVTNQNGSIEVRSATAGGACAALSLETSFAPVKVTVPAGAGFAVQAHTSFGKIDSELAVSGASGAPAPSSRGDDRNQSLVGRIGDGRCPLNVRNRNGNIELRRGG